MAATPTERVKPTLVQRLATRRGAGLFARNTIVSCGVFAFDLLLIALFIEWGGMNKSLAVAIGFVIANSLHYGLGRAWVFAGTERGVASGYLYFLVNATIGLTITLILFNLFAWMGLHYLAARVVASVFAGLTVFLLNAVLNFRSI